MLNVDEGYLFVLAGKIPDDLRKSTNDAERIVAAFKKFREILTE